MKTKDSILCTCIIRKDTPAGLRFSVEWARIEPEEGKFDMEEIEHYRKVIDC